jgi:hypothetical protein
MYRHRGRTVGTFVVGAIIVVTVIYVAFARPGSTTMPAPHFKAQLGATEPSPQAKPFDLTISPTTDECNKGWEAAVKLTKEQFQQFCERMQAAK